VPGNWFIVAVALFVLETIVPGVHFIWFGLAAAIVGILGLVIDFAWEWQLINFAILSQVLNGVLLPVVIILMLLLINRTDLMGKYKNSRLWNVIAWATSLIVIGMTLVMLWGMMPGH